MEKAKALLVVCASLLMLIAGFEIDTPNSKADVIPGGAGTIFAFWATGSGGRYILTFDGEVYSIQQVAGLLREETYDPPFAVTEIAAWSRTCFVSIEGEVWINAGGPDYEWVNHGSPPEGTPAQTSNWSQLKSSFGK